MFKALRRGSDQKPGSDVWLGTDVKPNDLKVGLVFFENRLVKFVLEIGNI
jgi:hypothetical protein